MLPRVRAFVSAMVRFLPLAVTVPKSFVELFRVILPAVPVPDETKIAVLLIVRLPTRFTNAICNSYGSLRLANEVKTWSVKPLGQGFD